MIYLVKIKVYIFSYSSRKKLSMVSVSDDQITIASKSSFTNDEQADDDDDLSFSRNIRGINKIYFSSVSILFFNIFRYKF